MRRVLRANSVAAMLVSSEFDVSYLSGFSGEDAFLLIGNGRATLITDGRYDEQARRECPDIDIFIRHEPLTKILLKLLSRQRISSLGVQAEHMPILLHDRLVETLKRRRVVSVEESTAAIRQVKDAGEVASIVKAVRVAENAMRRLVTSGARSLVGRRERDVAAELDYLMRQGGASTPAFETIVAAGPHGSLPHYRPGATRIKAGQAVLFDWGAKVGGYVSDLTRVAFTGRIPPRLAEMYETVRSAQAAGIAAVHAGASCRSADAAARKVVESSPFAGKFVHSLGHGIGREIHEGPGLASVNKQRLRAGMVVTVEPGVYLPGVGGVRSDDDVLVTPNGCRRLSRLSSRLQDWVLR